MKKKNYQSAQIEITEIVVEDILKVSLLDPDQGTWDPMFDDIWDQNQIN